MTQPIPTATPKEKVIEFCEALLDRAKSGELQSLAIVEFRTGERMDANFREIKPIDALKAVTFLGHLTTTTFIQAQTQAAPKVQQ